MFVFRNSEKIPLKLKDLIKFPPQNGKKTTLWKPLPFVILYIIYVALYPNPQMNISELRCSSLSVLWLLFWKQNNNF